MMTCRPRLSAVDAYSAARAGVRCADTTFDSWGTPKRSRISAACRIVSQSDLLPMMMPTRGAGSSMELFHHGYTKDTKDTSVVSFVVSPPSARVESAYEARCGPARAGAGRACRRPGAGAVHRGEVHAVH